MGGSLLDRYRSGEREAVWHELRQLGAHVHDDPSLAADAQAVCDEMAKRARSNIETIIGRLTELGYEFKSNDGDGVRVQSWVPPTPTSEVVLAWLEENLGLIPMTLKAWMRTVGDVWLVGSHPAWAEAASADPLVIELEGSRYPGTADIRDSFASDLECWALDAAEHEDMRGRLFILPVAPDRLTKQNISGGLPYGFALPDGCADALFSTESGFMPFVSYLNLVFARGGFPGRVTDGWKMTRPLAEGLLPL